jgi:hypothetical protein
MLMVKAAHLVAETDCPHLWTKFSRLCGTVPTMRALAHRTMPAGNMRQNVQKPEQLDAAFTGNMTTVRMAIQATNSPAVTTYFVSLIHLTVLWLCQNKTMETLVYGQCEHRAA